MSFVIGYRFSGKFNRGIRRKVRAWVGREEILHCFKAAGVFPQTPRSCDEIPAVYDRGEFQRSKDIVSERIPFDMSKWKVEDRAREFIVNEDFMARIRYLSRATRCGSVPGGTSAGLLPGRLNM